MRSGRAPARAPPSPRSSADRAQHRARPDGLGGVRRAVRRRRPGSARCQTTAIASAAPAACDRLPGAPSSRPIALERAHAEAREETGRSARSSARSRSPCTPRRNRSSLRALTIISATWIAATASIGDVGTTTAEQSMRSDAQRVDRMTDVGVEPARSRARSSRPASPPSASSRPIRTQHSIDQSEAERGRPPPPPT